MNIAIIPARGGSKRIPRKNIKTFNSKPMIAWSIALAKDSGLFDHIVVSTDDNEIVDIALSFGAEIPFIRPAKLANDVVETVPVIAHAVSTCRELGWFPSHVCCIYPCAPFTKVQDLVAGLEMLKKNNAEFVYPIVEFPHPIQRAMLRSERGNMTLLNPGYELMRTQDIPKTYHDAGQFYWGTSSAWLDMKKMHSEGLGLIIPHWRIVDIDTPDDWKRAELLYQIMQDS